MEGNESEENEKHETGKSEEKLELVGSSLANDGHNNDNVISKSSLN